MSKASAAFNVLRQALGLGGKTALGLGGATLTGIGIGAFPELVKLGRGVVGGETEAEAPELTPLEKREQDRLDSSTEFERQRTLRNDLARQRREDLQSETSAAQLAFQQQLIDVLTNPELLRESQAIRTEAKLQEYEAAQRGAMEQTRELSRRLIEKETISAWQGITQAQINRDTAMGLGMMSLAFTAGMPNPNTMKAAAGFAQTGAAGFSAPKSIY